MYKFSISLGTWRQFLRAFLTTCLIECAAKLIMELKDKKFKVSQTLPQLIIEGKYRAALVPRGWPTDNNGVSSRGCMMNKRGRGVTQDVRPDEDGPLARVCV